MNRTLKRLPLITLAGFFGACGVGTDAEFNTRGSDHALCHTGALGQAINSTGKVPDGCVKIEGGEIGQVPQTLEFSGLTVTIDAWVGKDGEPEEKVGFAFTSSGAVAFAVKAGGRTFVSEGTSWVHPEGTGGPEANGISNVTFCPAPGSDSGTDPDGGTPGTPGDDFDESGGGGAGGTDGGTPGTPGDEFDESGPGGGSGGECGGPDGGAGSDDGDTGGTPDAGTQIN